MANQVARRTLHFCIENDMRLYCFVTGDSMCERTSQMKRFKPGSWRRALDWLVRSPSAMPSVLSRLFSLSADYSRTEKSPLSRFSASPLDHPTSSIAPMPPHAPGAHPDLGHSQFCVGMVRYQRIRGRSPLGLAVLTTHRSHPDMKRMRAVRCPI